MDVGTAGVEAHLQAQGFAAVEHGDKLLFGDYSADAPFGD
jgi:hypothetical protein